MPFGYLDTKFIDLPSNIDPNYLRGLTTARGISFAQILTQLDSRLGALNTLANPLVAQLISYTTEAAVDQSTPTAMPLTKENEYGLPRPIRAEMRGAMLPIDKYAMSLAFTEDFLDNATMPVILNQFDSVALSYVRGQVNAVLTRLTSDAEVPVDNNTSATSPGFAGSGTGGNIFGGTYPNGSALPTNYTLYYRDTSANLALVIKTARNELKKWWPGPYDLIGSQAQIDLVTALPGFVWATSPLVNPAQGTATANVDADLYLGVYDSDIRVHFGMTEYGTEPNLTLYKTFGAFDARNPLGWRFDPNFGRGVVIRSRELFPLDQAVIRQKFGIGVANRTAAANIRIGASGNYVPPVLIP